MTGPGHSQPTILRGQGDDGEGGRRGRAVGHSAARCGVGGDEEAARLENEHQHMPFPWGGERGACKAWPVMTVVARANSLGQVFEEAGRPGSQFL
jgi:hypothetical protein